MEENYKEQIIGIINELNKCDKIIFGEGLNLLMNGELKEVNKDFDKGEIYQFNIKHLENSTDNNVRILATAVNNLRNSIDSLQNINAIKDEEINWD